eukprot:scaffold38372_cov388-Isochrysis_galbana.AAC.1
MHPPRGAKSHIHRCYTSVSARLSANLDDLRLWKLLFALPRLLFAPLSNRPATDGAPTLSITATVRRR